MIRTGVYISSKRKTGRPLSKAECGRLGGIALKEKRDAEAVEKPPSVPLPTTFYFKGESVIHAKCKRELSFNGISRSRFVEQEVVFQCFECRERVFISLLALARAQELL